MLEERDLDLGPERQVETSQAREQGAGLFKKWEQYMGTLDGAGRMEPSQAS